MEVIINKSTTGVRKRDIVMTLPAFNISRDISCYYLYPMTPDCSRRLLTVLYSQPNVWFREQDLQRCNGDLYDTELLMISQHSKLSVERIATEVGDDIFVRVRAVIPENIRAHLVVPKVKLDELRKQCRDVTYSDFLWREAAYYLHLTALVYQQFIDALETAKNVAENQPLTSEVDDESPKKKQKTDENTAEVNDQFWNEMD